MSYVSLKNIINDENDKEKRATVGYVDNAVKNTFEILNAAGKLGNAIKLNNGVVEVESSDKNNLYADHLTPEERGVFYLNYWNNFITSNELNVTGSRFKKANCLMSYLPGHVSLVWRDSYPYWSIVLDTLCFNNLTIIDSIKPYLVAYGTDLSFFKQGILFNQDQVDYNAPYNTPPITDLDVLSFKNIDWDNVVIFRNVFMTYKLNSAVRSFILDMKFSNAKKMTGVFYNSREIDLPNVGQKVLNMESCYYNCLSLSASPFIPDSCIDAANAYYNCFNIVGNPMCGKNSVNFTHTYYNCCNLTGSPQCGNNVINFSYAYYNCANIVGKPQCGNNVINFAYTYWNCSNLIGPAVCSDSVVDMAYTYCCCRGITSPWVGNNVENMAYAYSGIRWNTLTTPVFGISAENCDNAYASCGCLGGDSFIYSPNIYYAGGCFDYKWGNHRLNLYILQNTKTYNAFNNIEGKYGIFITNNSGYTETCWLSRSIEERYMWSDSANIYIYWRTLEEMKALDINNWYSNGVHK